MHSSAMSKSVLGLHAALLSALTFALLCDPALGFSSGAPISACSDITQQHSGVTPVDCGPSCPYSLSLVAIDGGPVPAGREGMYRCGALHTFRLESSGDPFRGLAVQARESTPAFSSSAAFIGQFTNAPVGGLWQIWNCASPSATHTNNNDKTVVDLTWQAPGTPSSQDATFWFSITRVFVNVHAQIRGLDLVPDPAFCSLPGVTLGFFEEDYALNEGNSATVTVTKDNPNQSQIDIDIVPLTFEEYAANGGILPSEISAVIDTVFPAQFISGGKRDFSNQPVSVSFPPSQGSDSVDASIGSLDDFINEAQEGFIISISVTQIDPVDVGSGLTFIREGVALVRINDDDQIRITFPQQTYTVMETAGIVSNLITLDKMDSVASEQNLTVLLNFVAASATAGEDYVDAGQMEFTFLVSDVSLPVSFDILDDSDADPGETFALQITLPPNPPLGLLVGNFPQTTITIEDDDGTTIEIGFVQDSYTFTEGETVTIEYAILSNVNDLNLEFVSLDVEPFSGTATEGADYSVAGFDTFGFLDEFFSSEMKSVMTIDDTDVEGSEDFVFRLTIRSGGGETDGNFVVTRSQTTVVILDNDGVGPTSLEIIPNPIIAGIEGNFVEFMCGPIGTDPIELLIDGIVDTSLSFDDSTGNRTYTIGPLDRSMNATTYQCTSGSLQTEISTLIVYYAPEYTVGGFFEVNEGDTLRVDLLLDGFPLPPSSFSWMFNGQPLANEPGRVMLGENFIQIDMTVRDDRGLYTVTATNLAGNGSASFDVEVYYPPSYIVDPNFTVVEGTPFQIALSLDARPSPGPGDFSWLFNNQPLVSSSEVNLDIDSISWPSIQRSDAGPYFVESFNRAGTGGATFNVTVIYPPVYTVDDVITVIEGNPVRIDLQLDANPDPSSFEWQYEGQPLTPPTGGALGVDFIDFGSSINRSASGSYFIQSTNEAGTGNTTFELIVQYPPQYTVNNSFTVQEGDPFDLTLLLDALPLPGSENFTWFFNGQMLSMMPGITFGLDFINIQMATRLDSGTYRVVAENVAGTGEASFDLQVQIPPSSTPSPMPSSTSSVVPLPSTSTPMPTPDPTSSSIMPDSSTPMPGSSTPVPDSSTPVPESTSTDPNPTFTVVNPSPSPSPGNQGGMFGDPHFSVLLPNGQLLCFSVQGEQGYAFNLISNNLIQMNARFVPDARREEVTWIGSLGIVVTSKKMNATKIRFEADEKKVFINDKMSLQVKKIDKLTLSRGKLTISEALRDKKEKHLQIEVHLPDIGLSFNVRFTKSHIDMTWNKVGKQPVNSHGIIGQFFHPDIEIDEARRLLVLPEMEPVPVMRKPVWHFMERDTPEDDLCWVAMNPGYQGKKLLQGHYLDYLVDDVLSNKFKFKPKTQKKSKKASL